MFLIQWSSLLDVYNNNSEHFSLMHSGTYYKPNNFCNYQGSEAKSKQPYCEVDNLH